MADENITENPFFLALKKRFPDIYEMAQKSQSIVMVPQCTSIPSGSISLRLIEAHIYKPSPYFKEQYVSLDNHVVEIDGDGFVTTQSGFSAKRKAKILFEETFYNADYKAFRVLCLDRPLIGEIARVEQWVSVEPPPDFSFASAREWLHKVKDAKDPLDNLTASIREFNQTFVIVKGFDEYVLRKVRGMVTSASAELKAVASDMRGVNQQMLTRILESYTLGQMHGHLFTGLQRIHAGEDELVKGILKTLEKITLDDLSVPKQFQADFSLAVEELNQLNVYRTPIDRLECLGKTTNHITHAATQTPVTSPLSTDDLLPLVVYVITKSSIEWIESNLHYMSTFLTPEFATEELGFHLVTFQAAIEFLKSKDRPVLTAGKPQMHGKDINPKYWRRVRQQSEDAHPINSPTTRTPGGIAPPDVIDVSGEGDKPMGGFLSSLISGGEMSSSRGRSTIF